MMAIIPIDGIKGNSHYKYWTRKTKVFISIGGPT
jgi:hypothetical protein